MKSHWNNESHYSDFTRLNHEWIEKHFVLEEFDRQLAKDPSSIIRAGGTILSITDKLQVVGVCALFQQSDDSYELARMAVSIHAQGKGIGSRLIQEIITFLKGKGCKKITLVSNSKLQPAIRLYEKFGFKTVSKGQHPVYKRGNIIMEKNLSVSV